MMLFVRSVATLARAQVTLTRASASALELVGGVALHSLHERELDRLAALIYDEGSLHRGDRIEDWEARWWSSALPATPGRILVGGCGAGRELVWLLERGWAVEGFDPAASLVATARRRVGTIAGGRARIDVLDFAAFVDDANGRGPFDAVLLGWGSMSHCLSDTARARLLRSCADMCPRGPILLSWHDGTGLRGRQGRARALGARVGAALGALRGVEGAWRDRVLLLPHAGPTAFLDEAEVRALAGSVGRRLIYHDEAMPHGALIADGPSSRAIDDEAIELLADVLSTRGRHQLVARGGSMKPAIPSGSTIELARLDQRSEPLRVGQVVAARVHGSLLVHRIVGMDAAGGLLLKGDACASPDGWVDASAVVGRVTSVDPASRPNSHPRGPHAVPVQRRALPRWRRGLLRLGRAAGALRAP